MLKITIFSLCILVGAQNRISAQSLQHTKWKSFFEAPINDTATLSIAADTLVISNSHGMAVVVSAFHIAKDTIDITDISGPIKCAADEKGIYHYAVINDKLTLTVFTDACDGRANALSGRAWQNSK